MDSPPSVQLEEEVGDEPIEEDTPAILSADKFTLPSRADEVLSLWRTKMEEGVLSPSHFLDHWRVTVPRIYSPQPNRNCLGWIFDEELASKLLIQPLEQFVWGTEKGEQPVVASRATLCGRVFKQGEPAYSCRECGMDNTCVLCVECFKVSAHRHHKYKMGQSGGGGCCDCGDLEAWKKEPFCELHSAPNEKMEQSDDGIKPEVVERMKIVANVILSYCFRLLTLEHAPDLPNDLKLKDAERDPLQVLDQVDCYCTVLYNDETHTFEQVISTLSRVMSCDHRDSVELVTLIDREGRAIVKCSSFSLCDKLKTDIERYATQYGPTLKVLVLHAHVAAHQMFAMKMLQWLQQFVSAESKLRIAVSTEALGEEKGSPGVVVGVMQNDCNMWKAARTAWHRLLISTTLMDYNSKKRLSILFTKNYGSIMKDFIRDDHDHSCSVSSLSVQLYTTPTLAHHLIAKHGALATVLNTFVSECTRRCKKGRLEFVRDHTMNTFKRAQFILYDVKYLLSAVPTVWDDELRQGFLHGLNLLLNLFTMMQGMEPVTRQVGQHMEYEPDWESAFNLHVKLTHSITLALEWCGSDRTITAKAYRMTLRHLAENDMCREPHARVKLSHPTQWQDTLVIAYDVSKQPVSIHQPLSRFLAGLHLLLDRYGFSYNSSEFTLSDKPKPMVEQLIEPMLRVAVLMAQVHMGMWRRNGFSLLNQLYFYHNVKCRAEMLDRDIIMLQIGASLIESNEFLVHVLNKYSLVACMSPQIEDLVTDAEALRPVSFMVEECLELLTNVIGSRYVPGVGDVTQEERIKKEIIQMLCVKPMAHSELNRCLTEDQVHETGLEAVIDEVADFNRSTSGAVRGKYTLKPHLYDEYDMFFYHYTKEDLSRSEERQRNRRKAEGLPECCPPPPLPKLTQPFRMIANLMQCEAALYVLKTVFERALDLTSKCFSEGQVHKALHLMGYALRDEESGHYEFLSFAESAHRAGLHILMQQLAVSPRVTAMRPLLLWTLQKMRTLLANDADKVGDAESMETDQEEKPTNSDDNEKARRTKLAAERRSALMAQMEAARNSFMSNNATMFAEAMAEDEAREAADTSVPTPRTALGGWGAVGDTQSVVCMLCQEEARVEIQSPAVVMVAFVQYSTVIRKVDAASHVSSCGHTLHASCYKKYVDTVVDKENRRPYRLRQPAAFDIENKEYLCPLCERLCNTALPLLPTPPLPSTDPPPLSEEMYEQCTDIVLKHQGCLEAVHYCTEECEEMHCIAVSTTDDAFDMDNMEQEIVEEADTYVMTHSKEIVPKEFLEHFNMEVPAYDERMELLLDDFANILSKVCNYDRNLGSTWALGSFCKATAYTLMCSNASLRVEERPLLGELPARIRVTLRALVRVAAAVPALWPASRQAAHHALTALDKLERSSPAEHDTFITLTTLVFCSPALFSHRAAPARPANLTRQFALRALRCALVRAALSDEPMDQDSQPTQIPDISTWPVLKQRCHTFLRCCCLLFYFLSDVEPPTKLTELNGDTWEAMCEYLNLPSSYEELLGSDSAKRKIQQWTELSVQYFGTGISRNVVLERLDPPNLIDLPDDFSELMNIVSEFSCPNSESEDCKYPTMCLACGEILCSQSYCCQSEVVMIGRQSRVLVGAVMSHVLNCGGSAGIFLRVRDCEMLLLAAPGRGVMTPAPYLDSYGETDQGLRRGNPLRLCTERYAELRKMWLNHGIQERIARPNDYHIHVTTQWVNM